MEFDNEDQGKSYTTLSNVNLKNSNDLEFKFEKFLLSGNSDSEADNEDMISDDYQSDEETSNFEYSIQDLTSSSQHFSLTTEDWSVINSSQHPELRKSLILNRNVKYMTLQLFNKIKNLLIENQDKIKTLKKSLSKNESKETSLMILGQLGAPYFKTKKNMFGSDVNKDTLDRRKRGLLTVYQTTMSTKWSKSECDNLSRGVQLTYNHNRQKAVLKELSTWKLKLDKEEEDSENSLRIVDKIEQLEGELRNLKAIGIKDIPPLSQDKLIDWEHISTEFLMEKHNAQECSTFWKIYLHPDINKSNWTSEENKKIKFLADKYNKQDWDQIAAELGTNRTGFSVFLYYASAICDQLPKSRFTDEEDSKLVEVVENKKIGSYIPWNTVAEYFPNRTKFQLMHRYKYYLCNLEHYTRGFTDAEDILIIALVERFGRNYVKFTKYLPTKSYMQIKSRYDNHLRFKRIKGSFTVEEDRKIWAHFTQKNQEVGSLTLALNRNRLQIRQRYGKLKEFFEKNPDKSLEELSRRSAAKNETFRRLEFLKYIADQFKESVDVPSVEEIEKKLGKQNNQDIDVLLVNFFSTSFAMKQKPLEITALKISNAADKIYDILKSWRVNLKIPEELKKNNTLDIIDCEVLYSLRKKYQSDVHTPSIDDLLAPNMNSLIGLRGLLLKNQLFRKSKFQKTLTLQDDLPAIRNDSDYRIASELQDIFHNKDISSQCIIQNERTLFSERFVSLFMWPALLSIESPSGNLSKSDSTSQQIIKKKDDVNSKKRPMKRNPVGSSVMTAPKKIKINVEKPQTKPDSHKTIQPQRFSSRLKCKKQILDENNKTESEQESTAVKVCQSTSLNETDAKLVNSESMQPSEKTVEIEKCTNVKIQKYTKIIPIDSKEIRPQSVPNNLIKVDKSEIMRLLQNKKPIKIIKIKSIQKPDGTFSLANPVSIKMNDRIEKPIEAPGLNLENIKSKLKSKFGSIAKNTNINGMETNNSKRIKTNSTGKITELRPLSYKQDSFHSTKSEISEPLPESMECSHKDDLNKLDNFLNNVEEESCLIDLTENEILQREVEQLDQFIKQESTTPWT